MKKYTPILILILLVGIFLLGYTTHKSTSDNKRLNEEVKVLENNILELNKKILTKQILVDDLKDSVIVLDVKIDEAKEGVESSRRDAKKYKDRYIRLLNKEPITVEDSLEVSNEMVTVLVRSNNAQREVIKNQDSVIAVQGNQISTLKDVVANQDVIISHKDELIEKQRKIIERLKEENKKNKREKVFRTIRDIAIGIAIGALAGAL